MQVVNSLLRIQSRNMTDDKVKEVFKAAQNRVIAMALLHENIYQTEDFKDIDDRTLAEIKADVEKKVNNISQGEISLTAPTSSASFRGGGRSGTQGFSAFMIFFVNLKNYDS
mgnify:CR=1 FL=1